MLGWKKDKQKFKVIFIYIVISGLAWARDSVFWFCGGIFWGLFVCFFVVVKGEIRKGRKRGRERGKRERERGQEKTR